MDFRRRGVGARRPRVVADQSIGVDVVEHAGRDRAVEPFLMRPRVRRIDREALDQELAGGLGIARKRGDFGPRRLRVDVIGRDR